MNELSYESYSKDKIAVRGNRDKFQHIIKGLGGKWNPRMRGGAGWLLNQDQQQALDNIIHGIKEDKINSDSESKKNENISSENELINKSDSSDDEFTHIESNAKSRKDQNKYHREQSEEESQEGSQEESQEENDIDPIVVQMLEKQALEIIDQHKTSTRLSKKELREIQEKQRTEKERKIKEENDKENEKEEKRKHAYEMAENKEREAYAEKEERRKKKEQQEKELHKQEKLRKKQEIQRLEREKAERKARKQQMEKQDNYHHKKQDNRHKYKNNERRDTDPVEYYQSFSKKPIDFQKIYGRSDSESYSSSTSRSESSDDFPSPDTPVKRKNKDKPRKHENNHNELFDKVKDLQRRLYEMEIQNRKLKAEKRH